MYMVTKTAIIRNVNIFFEKILTSIGNPKYDERNSYFQAQLC